MKKSPQVILIIVVIAIIVVALLFFIINKPYIESSRLIKEIKSENVDQVKKILDNGVDPNETNIPPSWIWVLLETSPVRPLSVACEIGNLEIVEILVLHGATAEPNENCGWSPLMATLFYYHPDDVEIVDVLLENGANPKEDDAAFVAAQMTPKVYDKEKKNGTVFSSGYDEEVAQGITEIVIKLSENQSINSTSDLGRTLLIESVRSGNVYLAEYLLSVGADADIVDVLGKTALDYAKETQNDDMVLLLTTT